MQGRRLCALVVILLVELVGLGYFIKGFFPYKKSLPGFAGPGDQPWDIDQPLSGGSAATSRAPGAVGAQYDRLVIMLVDALRNDFVFGNNSAMEYTQGMLRTGDAIGFTAKALAPTVTMPRLKALMTGTVPNFLDAVLNIAESDTSSSLKYHDNLLWQLKNHGNKTINMFGDDTWLRLFPEMFTRTDGTSSFFVTDTVEVDRNVTRHVRPELERSGWDVTIFHYLGLDHIGHLAGPNSPLMRPKQKEMDDVVRDAYEIVAAQDKERMKQDKSAKPTLFVLLGDHAMNEIGNHGGNSQLETSTVFVFLGQGIRGQPLDSQDKNALSALMTAEVPQINLVPTLALLFGVPIPKNNLGMPLPELLRSYSDSERLRLLQASAHQMFGVVRANDPTVREVTLAEAASRASRSVNCDAENESTNAMLRCKYLRALAAHRQYVVKGSGAANKVEHVYYDFMECANEHLSRAFSGYDLGAMSTGMAIIGVSAVALAALYQTADKGGAIFSTSSCCLRISAPAVALLLTYLLSMWSSSLIEEEHQFWYFWTQTALALRVLTSTTTGGALRTVLQMVLFRTIRAWNQTGQKWTGEPDIRLYLNSSHTGLMWALVVTTAVVINVAVHRLHMYVYPGPVREAIARRLNGSSQQRHVSGARMYRRDADEYELRIAEGERVRAAVLYSGADTSDLRALVLAQRAFRAVVGYASFSALVYQMDRNQGWQALGVSKAVWNVVRWCVPPELAQAARLVYLCTALALVTGVVCTWLRARVGLLELSLDLREFRASVPQAAALDLLVGMLPVLLLLSRPHNIPLFAMFVAMFVLFWPQLQAVLGPRRQATDAPCNSNSGSNADGCLSVLRPSKLVVQLCLVYASFFALGNSNSLASLDLSNAYAGVSRYNEGVVGILMFASNWAGPLWWAAATLATLTMGRGGLSARRAIDTLVAAHLWQACTLFVLSVVVTLLRTHLFIWSVFSPRYLYQVGWLVGFYIISATCGGLLWLAGLAQVS
ncbi:major facilitator super transporter protein [Coemansia sp. BCRC 34301]|nr:major facilitator super transporter protein [Coemansia sp. BCRC 34301]